MKQKIEWYREVLEIEPNSKIFFPLSRMLVKDGRPDEAVSVLRQGVMRHPDHVEARLFLVEQLYALGRTSELHQEISVLGDLFSQYPNFWRAWGDKLFSQPDTKDAGLAAMFLAAYLQKMPVSWAGIIEQGLKGVFGGGTARVSRNEPYPVAPQPVASPVPTAPAVHHGAGEANPPARVEDDGSEDEDDEPITLRTRSMAEILAEQGDLAGAMDIYKELIEAAPDGEKPELLARLALLEGKAQGEAAATPETGAEAPKEDKKDWLSVLAQRLESRSIQ